MSNGLECFKTHLHPPTQLQQHTQLSFTNTPTHTDTGWEWHAVMASMDGHISILLNGLRNVFNAAILTLSL